MKVFFHLCFVKKCCSFKSYKNFDILNIFTLFLFSLLKFQSMEYFSVIFIFVIVYLIRMRFISVPS